MISRNKYVSVDTNKPRIPSQPKVESQVKNAKINAALELAVIIFLFTSFLFHLKVELLLGMFQNVDDDDDVDVYNDHVDLFSNSSKIRDHRIENIS